LAVTIQTLLADAPAVVAVAEVNGDTGTAIDGIAYDSRAVTPGALFVAWRGAAFDGHRFIGAALERGAVAVLAEEPIADPRARCVIVVPNSRAALAQLAAAFYRNPSRELGLIGVTGTKGKTTTSFLIEAILGQHRETGLIGTVDLKVGPHRWRNPAHQTTPESLDVQRLLREMADAGVEWAVLETSSHALATYRVDRCAYDIAVITNVTHEHLDFHGTYEAYLEAKATLFDRFAPPGTKGQDRPRAAIINRDDPGAATILGRAREVPEVTYGLSTGSQVRAVDVEVTGQGIAFTLRSPWGAAPVRAPLLGRFNVYNALAAAAACLVVGLTPEQVAAGLARFAGVPGRVQQIAQGQPFLVVVDFAHNADSLGQVLELLRGVTSGRLLALFGSGGERDVAKRAQMGRVCAERADFGIFTDEDPRGEDPLTIIEGIASGARSAGWQAGKSYESIPDRQEAIARAFELARPGDTVLLAGKGHENTIIYADRAIPWDEAAEARRALAKLGYGEGNQ
jgi:UDP-N-acetylmuramoyl-L-alanyl-D-glutamate--2,6-diaminopimelate ligase